MKKYLVGLLLVLAVPGFAYVDERDAAETSQLEELLSLEEAEFSPKVVLCGQSGFTEAPCTYKKSGTNDYFAIISKINNQWPNVYNQNPACDTSCLPNMPCMTYPRLRGTSSKDFEQSGKRYLYCATTSGRWLHTKPADI